VNKNNYKKEKNIMFMGEAQRDIRRNSGLPTNIQSACSGFH
jgi:hypothetical protein